MFKLAAITSAMIFSLGISSVSASAINCSQTLDHTPIIKKVIYFETGQTALSTEARKQIDQLVDVVTGNPSLKICAVGQADKEGDPDANKKLSLKRAESAKSYLIKKGIEKKRVETVFRGEAYGGFSFWGAADKKDEDRRVEIFAYSE
ncbi:OmpA family protein [Kiloniella antarctica]|uniref:OmpA family protein n=1 Tax=Kiloniella antarctica TaxID=1550907 RepID=A0ABW5BF99_9PROT